MRTRFGTHFIVRIVLAFNTVVPVSFVCGAEVPSPATAMRTSVIEVVAFGVAPVAGVSEKTFEHRYYRGLAALKEKLGGNPP